MQYFSLQHRTLLLSPVTSTTGFCFSFCSIPSFFLELFLHWSAAAYWAPTDLRSSSFSILSFCLFILFMGFSRQEYWSGLSFPSPVDHVLSDLSTMTHPSWVAPTRHGWISLSYTWLWSVWLDWLVFCEYGLCVCPLMPLATPTVLLGFLLPWTWGISSQLLQQSVAAAPFLGRGVSPHRCPSWPWTWSSSSRPSCARAARVNPEDKNRRMGRKTWKEPGSLATLLSHSVYHLWNWTTRTSCEINFP